MLTNRHVAIPWEEDSAYEEIIEKLSLSPAIRRMHVYFSGETRPLKVELVRASDDANVALLRTIETFAPKLPLQLSVGVPRPGDKIIALGYPTEVGALLTRAGKDFLDGLLDRENVDFWAFAEALATAGFVKPLASQGIVGQVTKDAIFYDAEITQGGRGGPVISLNGEVVAINAAIIPELGGSNLGVPVAHARALLAPE